MKDLYLVTGFLGAGKTTFLQQAVNFFSEEKVAIIVNEYGSVGVDGTVLKSNGIISYEITNGSIFCVCRKDLFMDALNMANNLDVDVIIVETSGLSDPLSSDDLLSQMKDLYSVEFNFKGIISLIDAKNFHKVLSTAVCVENQVKAADLFIINKCDLVKDLSNLKKQLILLNDEAKIIETSYCKINKENFYNITHKRTDSRTHKKDLILQKKLFEFNKQINFEAFNCWLTSFKDKAYRIKGFISTDKGYFNVECVMGDVNYKEVTSIGEHSFVVVLYNSKMLDYKTIGEL